MITPKKTLWFTSVVIVSFVSYVVTYHRSFYPAFSKDTVDKEIQGQHGKVIEEILERYGKEAPIPKTIASPDCLWVIQYDGCRCEKIIEDNKRNHGNANVQPVVS